VALLRGVNVNGVTVRSADLKALFESLHFGQVGTVLASGNVVFDAHEDVARLKKRIEAGLRERFGYDAWIVLATQQQVAAMAAAYPFAPRDASHHPYLVFFSSAAVLADLSAQAGALASPEEQLAAGDGVLYWEVSVGNSTETPVSKLLAKARYKPEITTRNLRTVEKIIAA